MRFVGLEFCAVGKLDLRVVPTIPCQSSVFFACYLYNTLIVPKTFSTF